MQTTTLWMLQNFRCTLIYNFEQWGLLLLFNINVTVLVAIFFYLLSIFVNSSSLEFLEFFSSASEWTALITEPDSGSERRLQSS